jgi:hypothetical protein
MLSYFTKIFQKHDSEEEFSVETYLNNIDEYIKIRKTGILDLSGRRLRKIPDLTRWFFEFDLRYINIQDNLLSKLPNMPLGIKAINCFYNELTSIDELQKYNYLTCINCSHNYITTIPYFKQYLLRMNFSGNYDDKLPENITINTTRH